jgi:hypothetical protein
MCIQNYRCLAGRAFSDWSFRQYSSLPNSYHLMNSDMTRLVTIRLTPSGRQRCNLRILGLRERTTDSEGLLWTQPTEGAYPLANRGEGHTNFPRTSFLSFIYVLASICGFKCIATYSYGFTQRCANTKGKEVCRCVIDRLQGEWLRCHASF